MMCDWCKQQEIPRANYGGKPLCDACWLDKAIYSEYCSRCFKRDSHANPVDVRYSYGIYAGNFCKECCYGFMDHCGIDQPQGSVQDLDDY